MEKKIRRKNRKNILVTVVLVAIAMVCLAVSGCAGYSSQSLYPKNVDTVCIEMFENKTFNRGFEYTLTDALAKRIEANTPYKIVSDKSRADSVISGMVTGVGKTSLSTDQETGRVLEYGVVANVVFSWKNLKTGEMIAEDELVEGVSSYSQWQNQGFGYGAAIAANNAAVKIVEMMETPW